MSGRMNRVKDALARTLIDVREDCRKHPNLYIQGFHNGLALADHYMNNRVGNPKFIEVAPFRTTPPAPVEPQPSAQDEQEYEGLVDKVLLAARASFKIDGCREPLADALSALDKFLDAKMEAENAKG